MHIKENIGEKTTFFDKISIIQNSFFLVFFADSNFFVSCFYINIITIIVCKAVMERNRLVKKKKKKPPKTFPTLKLQTQGQEVQLSALYVFSRTLCEGYPLDEEEQDLK